MNIYGQTKLKGELAVSQILEKYFVVCIEWVFYLNGKNFIKTILNEARHMILFAWLMTKLAHRPYI